MFMKERICIVTGGNRGIGREVVRGLVRKGAHVVLVSRDAARGREAADEIEREGARTGAREGAEGTVEPMVADLASQASIRAFAADFRARHDRLDVLVNNAAVIVPERSVTVDGLETQFAVNHLAPFLLTRLLLDPLLRGAPSRIIVVASQAHRRGRIDFGDLQRERHYRRNAAYSGSKLANVLFTHELDRRLRETGVSGVTVNAIHPGVVTTGLLGSLLGIFAPFGRLMLSPARGAEPIVALATDPAFETVSGAYFNRGRRASASRAARDPVMAQRLWEASEALCGLEGPLPLLP